MSSGKVVSDRIRMGGSLVNGLSPTPDYSLLLLLQKAYFRRITKNRIIPDTASILPCDTKDHSQGLQHLVHEVLGYLESQRNQLPPTLALDVPTICLATLVLMFPRIKASALHCCSNFYSLACSDLIQGYVK
jgi:hypothetical protein